MSITIVKEMTYHTVTSKINYYFINFINKLKQNKYILKIEPKMYTYCDKECRYMVYISLVVLEILYEDKP